MGFILGCLWYLFTAGLTIVGLGFATILFAFVIGWTLSLPFYGPYEAFGDVQFILIALLIHDRFIGPYAKSLRKVAKYIPGRKTVSESYEYDGIDRHV